MTYKETLFFIGKSLTINHIEQNRLEIEANLKSNTVDWDAVVKVSTEHYVFPALYCIYKRANFLKYLPEDLVGYMEHITNLNRERNQQIIEQAKEINELLLYNNITPIFLKGTGNLLEGFYEDIGERMVGDIDFIVEKHFFFKTIFILKLKGYVNKDSFVRNFHWHYPKLINDEKIASVEVHQKILRDQYDKMLNLEFFKNLKQDNRVHIVSNNNKALIAILPKIINDNLYSLKKISLRNAYDIFLLSIKYPFDLNKSITQKTEIKLNNYLFLVKLLLSDSHFILCNETRNTKRYCKAYKELINGDKYQVYKSSIIKKFISIKTRIHYYKYFFTNKTYRDYVLKRIYQLK